MAVLRLWRRRRAIAVSGMVAGCIVLIAGCGSSSSSGTGGKESAASGEAVAASGEATSSSGESSESGSTQTLKVVLAWYPTPEYGGLYAAVAHGFFKEQGLEVEIKIGGPQVSATQVVGAGQAEIGYLNNDETLMQALQDGIQLTEFGTTYEQYPEALEYQKSHPIHSFSEANGKTISMVTGSVDYEWLQHKYNLKNKTTPYSYATFAHDPSSLLLGYATDDVPTLAAQKIQIGYLPVSESGLNPYADILFAKTSFVKEHAATVKKFMTGLVEGWAYYRNHYEEINKIIFEAEPNTPLSTDNAISKTQDSFIYGGAAETNGIGTIELARVENTYNKLRELKVITKTLNIEEMVNTTLTPKVLPPKAGS